MAEQLVHFQPLGRRTDARKGKTLLRLAHDAGVAIESICGSAGKCGKCRVIIRSGAAALSRPTESEKKLLGERIKSSGMRLACQASVITPAKIVVEVPEESRRGHHRLLAAGVEPKTRMKPAMTKLLLKIPPASLSDLRADDDRLVDVVTKRGRERPHIHPGVHAVLPRVMREKEWTATATLYRRQEIVQVESGDATGSAHGVAVDIGTTKVVAYLIDLRTGDMLGAESMPNPQIPFGEDVMSRISYTIREKEGAARLQSVITDGVNALISRLCEHNGLEPEAILEAMVVGNTAMHHLFFGIPAQHVAAAPYAPAVRTSLTVSPEHLGLNIYRFGKVSSLPNVAGFVGADAVADLVSSGLHKDKRLGMMIDIGTNTEIIAGDSSRLVSCSCASGPAFEGAHIRFGMRASTGAIERVWIDPSTTKAMLRTVDDAPPRGICGSGIVDTVSELLKAGLIDTSGKLQRSSGRGPVRKSRMGGMEFVLAPARETALGEDITITQLDIQQIQLAKAAIFTGVAVLLRKLKVRCSGLARVYAAGAFGTYVDAKSAINIGMYPDVPVDKIKFIGNAAGSGARMALKSTDIRDLAEDLSKEVEYVELAAEPDFQKEFAQAMFLPHRDLSRFPNHASTMARR